MHVHLLVHQFLHLHDKRRKIADLAHSARNRVRLEARQMPLYSIACSSRTDGRLATRRSAATAGGRAHTPPSLAPFDPGLTSPDGAVCALSPTGASCSVARDFTSTTLRSWGLPEVTEDAVVVVSELVTNAVRHGIPPADAPAGDRPVKLTLVRNGRFVVCIVADPGSRNPTMRTPDHACEGGRGLHIVEALSRTWGWTPLPGMGKAVWAALDIP
jgi:anti-sigma regulatory factor (Ser/Thr protein kinase)